QSRHENHMQYGNPQGLDIFIQTYQAYLQQSRRIFGRDIVVTNGSQEGIYLALKLPIKPGDIVAMAQLCYPNASQIVSPLGGKVRGVNMDTQGLCPEHLEMICRKHSVRALYLTPLHQYPTTITLSAKRRQMIYEVCRKYQVAIIEDDYDHEFHFDTKPQAPMASGDVDLRIIYLSTLSKTIFPGLRLGVIAAPPNISERLARLKDQLSGETNAVGQLAVAYWMQTEGFERYLRTMRRRYQGKRDMVHNLLQQANHKQKRSFFSYNLPLGGLAFWISIPTPIETLQSHCEDKGYTLRDTNFYAIDKLPNNSFRLSYAGLDESGLEQGIKVLTDLAKKQMV
ncbi:MAG: PLP-dependent aminotransferase family protein, partial [Pseudobacteriovorax sp.]|nr:PLP-dependent aminotransferase family protein [Pseudobacteriovorax sp.]